MPTGTDLGRRIRSARDRKGITQMELAQGIGVSRDTVWRMEKGGAVHHDHLLAALRFLGLDVAGLTSAAEPDEDRQALARALLRAYDESPQVAAALDAIAKPYLDESVDLQRARERPQDEHGSVVDKRGRARTARHHR